MSKWHFPMIQEVVSKTKQKKKIHEELFEFLHEEDRELAAVECFDIIHACETFLRQNYTEDEIEKAKELVENKNRHRGYYGECLCPDCRYTHG